MNSEPDYELIGWNILADAFMAVMVVVICILMLPVIPIFLILKYTAKWLGKRHVDASARPNS